MKRISLVFANVLVAGILLAPVKVTAIDMALGSNPPSTYNPAQSTTIAEQIRLCNSGAIPINECQSGFDQITHPVTIVSNGSTTDSSLHATASNTFTSTSTSFTYNLYDTGYGMTPAETNKIVGLMKILPVDQISNMQSITFNGTANCTPSYGAAITICAQQPTASDYPWEIQNQLFPAIGRHIYETVLTAQQQKQWQAMTPAGTSAEDYFSQQYQCYAVNTDNCMEMAVGNPEDLAQVFQNITTVNGSQSIITTRTVPQPNPRQSLPPTLFIASLFKKNGTFQAYSTDNSGNTTVTLGSQPKQPGNLRIGSYEFSISNRAVTGYTHYLTPITTTQNPDGTISEQQMADQYIFDPPIQLPFSLHR